MDAEELLVARLVAGDESALGEITQRYGALVYGLARRVTLSVALAEDVAQDVFVELWRRPDRFDPQRGSLRTFLALQAQRRAVDAVRTATRRSGREQRHHDLASPLEVARASDIGPDDVAERRHLEEQVREAVNQLPSEQRIVIELAYYGGRSQREVASELGIPEGTAKSRMRLALSKLKPLLDAQMAHAR